jgi:hypothetical protein
MRPSALILVLLLGAVAFPRDGHAEKVKANQETKLFARPGERAKVILKVTEGKQMTVLAKEGRWLKVRVMGRTGYVARSTVDQPDGDEMARNTRRRSFVDGRGTKRGFGGQEGPDDRIGADAVGEGQEDVKKGGDDEDEDEDDEEDTKPVAKKDPPKKEPKKAPPKKGSDDDDEDEDDDENPIAKKGGKQVATAKKGGDDDEDEEDEDDEDTRKRVKLSKKTSMYNEADTKSEVILVATADTPLFPTGEKMGKFTEVENEEGDLGYILTADISSGGEVKVTRKDDDEDDEDEEEPAPRGAGQIDLRARLGVKLVSQALRSPGGLAMPPDNYNLSTSAAMVALGGGYYRPFGKKLVIGAEGNYEYANAFGGIPVTMGGMKTKTKIAMHNLTIRGILGYDFKKASGMMLLGRLGYQYYSYQVADASSMTKNLGRFPSEIIQSPTIGAALAMPRLTGKIGLRFSVDFIPANLSYKQTKFLEDGKSPSAKGAIIGAGLTYKFKSSFDIQAGYDLTYTSATFGDKLDTSMRGHPMGGVKRTDTFHAVSVGIVKAF